MDHLLLMLTGLLPSLVTCCGKDFSNMTRKSVVDCLLSRKNYDPRIPPDFDKDVPTNVTVQLHIVSFHSVNEMSMDFTMTFYLRRSWTDERLAFPTFHKAEVLELDTRLVNELWVPDIFFRNEKSAAVHNVTEPNRLVHLHRNGTVMYSSRLSMTLSCRMNLLLFPLDTQICPVIIQSYAFSTSNVMFWWTEAGSSISKSEGWEASNHFYENGISTRGCTDIFLEESYACVMATFRLQRNLGFFLVHEYLPTVLIVILSWVGFWIDAGATPARITIGLMSVLTMATQSSGAQALLPRVSYIKAMDVWMAVCVAFVFASLLEFAYVNVLNRRKMVFQRIMEELRKRRQTEETANDTDVSMETSQCLVGAVSKGPDPRRVDNVSRWAFPACFSVFVLTYWVAYGALAAIQSARSDIQ